MMKVCNKFKRVQVKKLLKKSLHQWWVLSSYKIVKELTDPQIKVGDKVKSGDIIGYVEAMKVMNEITSDVDGEVVEIVADHGTNVEYDQVLVKLK